MLLVDHQIRYLCQPDTRHTKRFPPPNGVAEFTGPMVWPFSESVSAGGVISYGLDHAGYCMRLANEILFFKSIGYEIDPKKSAEDKEYFNNVFERRIIQPDSNGVASFLVPAHGGYILGHTVEYLRFPRWLKGRCVGKSTLARVGIIVNTTPAEPGWEGHLTLEIANVSPLPVRLYCGEGIAQMEFELLDDNPTVSYADKKGKYQNQIGVTPARMLYNQPQD